MRSRQIDCRVYDREKFHAKAYITHARLEVVGSSALVGSSNFTFPGLTENIELNVQITGGPVTLLQEWYEQHWDADLAFLYGVSTKRLNEQVKRNRRRFPRDGNPFHRQPEAAFSIHRDHVAAGE